MGKAANYGLLQWSKRTRSLAHAELELSNNPAENSLRPVTLGRNYVRAMIMYSPQLSSAARDMAGLVFAYCRFNRQTK